MEFIGNLGVELCEDILTLLRVRSTSRRSVPVILFGGDDDEVNYFKLMTHYSFQTDVCIINATDPFVIET